jgi:hypothetical protein
MKLAKENFIFFTGGGVVDDVSDRTEGCIGSVVCEGNIRLVSEVSIVGGEEDISCLIVSIEIGRC